MLYCFRWQNRAMKKSILRYVASEWCCDSLLGLLAAFRHLGFFHQMHMPGPMLLPGKRILNQSSKNDDGADHATLLAQACTKNQKDLYVGALCPERSWKWPWSLLMFERPIKLQLASAGCCNLSSLACFLRDSLIHSAKPCPFSLEYWEVATQSQPYESKVHV